MLASVFHRAHGIRLGEQVDVALAGCVNHEIKFRNFAQAIFDRHASRVTSPKLIYLSLAGAQSLVLSSTFYQPMTQIIESRLSLSIRRKPAGGPRPSGKIARGSPDRAATDQQNLARSKRARRRNFGWCIVGDIYRRSSHERRVVN